MPDDDKNAADAAPAKSKKKLAVLVVVGIMIAEAGLIFGVMKMVGTGASGALAGEGADVEGEGSDEGEGMVAEVPVAETDAYNNQSGRLYLYHLRVSALVDVANLEALETLVEERRSTILDRINTVIRSSDPNHLNEPGLETLRRQIKFELDKISGDSSLIKELLIPQLLQTRSNL